MPNEGVFANQKISVEKAKKIFASADAITSAIGHQGSAEAFTALGMPTEVNRINATMKNEDKALCLKVLGRIPEGQILTLQQLESVGFEFYEVTMLAANHNELETQASYAGAAPITGSIWKV